MNFTELKNLREGIHALRRKSCVYDLGLNPVEPRMCDCKYGIRLVENGRLFGNSEQCGCPELRVIEHILSVITEEEYRELIGRDKVV